MIQPIVEGHGEVEAFPALLRRIVAEGNANVAVGRPFRASRGQLTRKASLQRIVDLAWRQGGVTSVLVLFDSDDDCAASLAPQVLAWAQEVRGGTCAVTLACREYEAWFLAALESLRGVNSIRLDAEPPQDPETHRDAKGQLERLMEPGASYVEVVDQPRMSARFDLGLAFSRSRSFRHLVTSVAPIVQASEHFIGAWPPDHWINRPE